MRKIENHCVNCDLPCNSSVCSYRDVIVDYCDECEDEVARYRIENDDLCEHCAELRIKEIFSDLTLLEQADAVNINLKEIND